MRHALAIGMWLVSAPAWSNGFYDCPRKTPPKSEYRRIEAAAKVEGVSTPEPAQIEYCRQRGDGTLYARFKHEFVVGEDGSETWKDVGCADEASEPGGWGCSWREIRGLRSRLESSKPEVLVTLLPDMPVDEARTLIAQGYAALEAMNAPGGCQRDYCNDVRLRLFNEEAAKPGEWWLQPADVAGEYRLVKDPYYVQFSRVAEDGAVKSRARLDEYSYLE